MRRSRSSSVGPKAHADRPAALEAELLEDVQRRGVHGIDEGDDPPATRLERLEAYRAELRRIAAVETPRTSLFDDIARIVREHELPLQAFHDLLDAFAQDASGAGNAGGLGAIERGPAAGIGGPAGNLG